MRALILSNPIAGSGRAEGKARALIARLEERGVRCEHLATHARGEARAFASERSRGFDLVVAVGGDGTLNEVIDGLPQDAPPLGLLPAGTANVLAHELGLPVEGAPCADVLLAGHRRELDLMRVNGRVSFLMVGVGFDAAVLLELERRRRGPISKLSYLRPIAQAFARYRMPELAVSIDGAPFAPCSQAFFTNVRWLGTPLLRFDHAPRHGDGAIESYLLHGSSRGALPAWALRFAFARVAGAGEFRRVRRARIEAAEPVPYQIDGDFAGTTPLELEVLPRPLTLLAPPARNAP
ncbi:MAG: NAD(+)/NADH kinase [Planctomycetes bacterium]|nr:NAD(+)/NADH kinase [Planctomycetota bacterium]